MKKTLKISEKNQNNLIKEVQNITKKNLKYDKTGHDYKHTKRVLKNTLKISKNYPETDKEVLILASLLHDIAFKDGFVEKHNIIGAKQAEKILLNFNISKNKIKKITLAIEDHIGNFSKPLKKNKDLQIESKILRDADNLDALGKTGLKRMIAFSKTQKVPKIITKTDKLDQSLYGNLKFLMNWPKKMITPEAKKLGEKEIKPIQKYIKKLEKELKTWKNNKNQ